MLTINIHQAKTHLSRFVDQAAAGEEIVIARAGKPVARLGPLATTSGPRTLGLGKGRFSLPAGFDNKPKRTIDYPAPDKASAKVGAGGTAGGGH